eukprot:350468-Chlamydomonas_euryale.AAC.10
MVWDGWHVVWGVAWGGGDVVGRAARGGAHVMGAWTESARAGHVLVKAAHSSHACTSLDTCSCMHIPPACSCMHVPYGLLMHAHAPVRAHACTLVGDAIMCSHTFVLPSIVSCDRLRASPSAERDLVHLALAAASRRRRSEGSRVAPTSDGRPKFETLSQASSRLAPIDAPRHCGYGASRSPPRTSFEDGVPA